MKNVRLDNAMEELSADETELAIDGGSGAANKVPFVGGVVRKRRVSVLEESNGNCGEKRIQSVTDTAEQPRNRDQLTQPVVNPEIGQKVPHGHVGPAKSSAEIHQPGNG